MALISAIVGAFLCLAALVALTILLLRQKSSLIFDIYPAKGVLYHLKYAIARLMVHKLRQRFYPERVGQTALERLDAPQKLGNDSGCSYDVISFMAVGVEGQSVMVTLERREHGILKACVYVWLPDEGLYCTPQLPDMLHFVSREAATEVAPAFSGCGFHIVPEECMRRWHVEYVGNLRHEGSNRVLPVELKLQFEASNSAYFNYNRDLSGALIADSLAREAWNNAFYRMFSSVDSVLSRRTHYGQNGVLNGELRLDAKRVVPLQKLSAFRDHSFGTERCLSTINRYVYLTIFLNDGTHMIIGHMSQPSFFLSTLKVGYVYTAADGRYDSITACNFELYSYGEKGTPPQHQNFIVRTERQKYFVQVSVGETALRYMGSNWDSKVYNQFFSCTVNGVTGHGISEYLYRNVGGRPAAYSANDPDWYRKMVAEEAAAEDDWS